MDATLLATLNQTSGLVIEAGTLLQLIHMPGRLHQVIVFLQ